MNLTIIDYTPKVEATFFKFIELVWLKWFLAIMTSGAFFYSIFDDMNAFIQKKALNKLETLDPEARERVMKKHRDRINK